MGFNKEELDLIIRLTILLKDMEDPEEIRQTVLRHLEGSYEGVAENLSSLGIKSKETFITEIFKQINYLQNEQNGTNN